jgi:hypothetical protein
MNWIAPFCGILAVYTLAHASEPKNYCEQIPRVASCLKNNLYIQAASRCLGKFQGAIDASKARLNQSLLANSAAATAQKSQIENHQADLAAAKISLTALIRQAEGIQAELHAYSQSLRWPGYLSEENIHRLRLEKILSHLPCYGVNAKALADDRNDLEKKVAELKGTAAEVARMGGNDSSSLERLQQGQGGPHVATQTFPEPGRGKKGTAPPKASDITGTDSAKQK